MDYRLQEIINNIHNSDEHICKSIQIAAQYDRGFASKNIIDGLRTFVEQITLYIYCLQTGDFIHENYDEIQPILSKKENLRGCKPLYKLHNYLQVLASHYSIDEDASERAMIRYYSYLYDIRLLLSQKQYDLHILKNLEDFPLDTDHNLDDYYSKIAEQIDKPCAIQEPTSRFYVYSEKEFYVNKKKYYEIVLLNANDYSSKFDRIVVFSNKYILPNYAIKASFIDSTINIFEKNVRIKIVNMWEVSIRGCEIAKFLYLTGKTKSKTYNNTSEYYGLMKFLTDNQCTINDLINLNNSDFEQIKSEIVGEGKNTLIMDSLTYARDIILNNRSWSNTLSYLIYKMNNVILRRVLSDDLNRGLYILTKCYPFELMPFVTSLPKHNPSVYDLLESIDLSGREYELLVHQLLRKSANDNTLYFELEEADKEYYELAIKKYNSKLFSGHKERCIEKYNNRYYHKESEEATNYIIKKLKSFENSGVMFYDAIVDTFFDEYPDLVDSGEKKSIISTLFIDSRIAIVNGAAGTGKTTLLSYLPKLYDSEMIVLCVTNTALNNLRNRLGDSRNIDYYTIASIINRQESFKTDLLVVDECSTVNNLDFKKVLEKIDCECIVLAGDTYQIESIEFGNWFSLAQNFVKKECCYDLTFVHRTSNQNLKVLWEKVRNCDPTTSETIGRKSISKQLGNEIFKKLSNDEVILCLNYGGLYGVNNINNICQQMNPNSPFYWHNLVYKIGDPIIFNDSDRFDGYIKNNQKGVIVDIKISKDWILFTIKIDKVLKVISQSFGFTILDIDDNGTTIQFEVNKEIDYDKDSNILNLVPFDVSYAISIHKAQGLEFEMVKVIITDEVEDRISHNIFYTAITRAKNDLKIYWSGEVQYRVLERIKHIKNDEDKFLFSKKNGIALNGKVK